MAKYGLRKGSSPRKKYQHKHKFNNACHVIKTKRRGKVVNTPALYMKDLGFKTGYPELGFLHGSHQSLNANAGIVP
jgi:hypothetical protein